jgi:hypothetical protein
MAIEYTTIFHCKTLQILAKFGFLVRNQTIWQPCSSPSQQEPIFGSEGHFSEVIFGGEKRSESGLPDDLFSNPKSLFG